MPPLGGGPPVAEETGMVVVVCSGVSWSWWWWASPWFAWRGRCWRTRPRGRCGGARPDRGQGGGQGGPSARGRRTTGGNRVHGRNPCPAARGLRDALGLIAGSGVTRACWSRRCRGCRDRGTGRGRRCAEIRNAGAGRTGGDHGWRQPTRADAQPRHDRQCGGCDRSRGDEAIAGEVRLGCRDHRRNDGSLRKRVSECTRREDLFQGRVFARTPHFLLRPPHDPPKQSSVRLAHAARSPAFETRSPLGSLHHFIAAEPG